MPTTNELAPRRHHAAEAAKEFKAQLEVPPVPPVDDVPPVPPVPPVDDVPPVPPVPPVEVAPVEPAPAEVGLDIFGLGIDPPRLQQESGQPTPRELALQAELDQLRNQNGELTAAQQQILAQRESEQQELEELRAIRRQQEVDRLLSLEATELEALDPAQAQEIQNRLLRPVLDRQQKAFESQIDRLTKTLEAERQERQQIANQITERDRAGSLAATNQKIFAAHPDFAQLRQSEGFGNFLNSTIRGSSLKLEKLLANEYHSGNADFVIQAISEYKKGLPSLDDIAAAPAAGTATAPAIGGTDAEVFTQDDVNQWNEQVITGEISRAQFRENMAKFRAANQPN